MTRQSSSDLARAAAAAVALRPADGIAVTTERAFVIRIRDARSNRLTSNAALRQIIKGLTWRRYSAILSPEITSSFAELVSCERAQM